MHTQRRPMLLPARCTQCTRKNFPQRFTYLSLRRAAITKRAKTSTAQNTVTTARVGPFNTPSRASTANHVFGWFSTSQVPAALKPHAVTGRARMPPGTPSDTNAMVTAAAPKLLLAYPMQSPTRHSSHATIAAWHIQASMATGSLSTKGNPNSARTISPVATPRQTTAAEITRDNSTCTAAETSRSLVDLR